MTFGYVYRSMWQERPASTRDLQDYLEIWLLDDITDEELQKGYDYLAGIGQYNHPDRCTIDDCDRDLYSHGRCYRHYKREWDRANRAKKREQSHNQTGDSDPTSRSMG